MWHRGISNGCWPALRGAAALTILCPALLTADDRCIRPLGESYSPAVDECLLREMEDACPDSHGPDPCESRGTLFQWSYGTSFSGGPDLDAPLVTDRPDFTEASVTVGRGVSQLEFGYTYEFDSEDGTRLQSHSWGEPLLRHGIFADWLEFRIAVFPISDQETTGVDSHTLSGTEHVFLGLKIAMTPQEGMLPEMALVPQMTVPTGSLDSAPDEVLPGVNWLYGWDVTERLSIGGSTQFNRAVDDSGGTYTEWAQSLTAGVSLCEPWGAYTEWFAIFPAGAETAQVEHFYNGGFTYLLNDDVQFDIRAGLGLNSAAADFFAGTGLSIRFR